MSPMRLQISHTTRYHFDAPVKHGLQQLRLTPKNGRAQHVAMWQTLVTGGRVELSYDDFHNNHVDLISLDREITELEVRCQGMVEVTETHGVVGPHAGPAPLWLYGKQTARTKVGPRLRSLIRALETGGTDLDLLHGLNRAVHAAVTWETGISDSGWTAEQAATEGRGVCQDQAHVFIAYAREMGHPARYVSGYLLMEDRTEQEASHAWAEAHVDGLGWVGFDPANAQSPDIRYVRVATGLDYAEAAPVTGTRLGGEGERLSVEVAVQGQ